MARIAIVGTGPTGVYTFAALVENGGPLSIALFEKGEALGVGMPYSPQTAAKSMLANIASIEIPVIGTEYIAWLDEQPADRLRSFGLNPDDLDERQFTPRLLLGEYFRDQLMMMIAKAESEGNPVARHEATEVADILPQPDGLVLITTSGATHGPFDRIVLATGHDFPDADAATRSYFPSPWSGLIQAEVPAVQVGIMGTSLSSIDAAMAVAGQHGRFRRQNGELSFQTDAEKLHLTLMSRTGILPEADFYCPIPYEPLRFMTADAVAACAACQHPLDYVFDLLRVEITEADPGYAERIDLASLTVETFHKAYFARRQAADPFEWARTNLDEVEHNKAQRITVPWRYALLRMHEKIETLVPHLSDADRETFDKTLKPVFVDNYAAVPSESIRRLLALHEAGVLSVLALGENYDLERKPGRTVIRAQGETHEFGVFIDARGQRAMESEDIPFPSLRQALLWAGQDIPRTDDTYNLLDVPGYSGRLYLAAIPYLMHDRPFVQGITASADIGADVAKGILQSDVVRRAA